MVDIKPGDTVQIDDRTVKVETCWNQGHGHKMFKLTTGEVIADLHKNPGVKVITAPAPPRRRGSPDPFDTPGSRN